MTWGLAVVFAGYYGYLHYLQLVSHELATIGINVTKNEIPKKKRKKSVLTMINICNRGKHAVRLLIHYSYHQIVTRLVLSKTVATEVVWKDKRISSLSRWFPSSGDIPEQLAAYSAHALSTALFAAE